MKHGNVFGRADMAAFYSWINDTFKIILKIILIIFYLWILLDSDVEARSLHKDFAFTRVVWLVCSTSSEVTGQLKSFSGHKICLCVGKFMLRISSAATKVTMLILLCFFCKGQEQKVLNADLLCGSPRMSRYLERTPLNHCY